jgi:phage FluMu gp28-like protein
MIMFDRIQGLIQDNSILNQALTKKTRTTIKLLNNSKIIALPCSENLLRGYTADLVICDEAAFIPEEVIVQVIFPMLSATDGSAILLSTPWGKDHFFHKAYTNPNYSVHHAKSTQCPLTKPEFLEEQKHNMTEEAFRSEYLAEFTESTHSFFPQDLIRNCIDNELELIPTPEHDPIPKGEYYAGADFGKLNDHSAIAILRQEDNTIKLAYLHEFPINTPYSNVIGHITRANKKFNIEKILVDQTGVGEPVLEELKAQDNPNTEGITFTVNTKETLLTSLKITMEQKRLKIPYHRRLIEQINQQQYEYSKTGHLTFSHPAGSHDDMLWALSLATWAAVKQATPTLKITE